MPKQNDTDLRWILTVLRRWWWLVGVCTLLGVGVAWFVTARMTPTYEATSTLLVQPAEDTRSSDYSDLIAAERLTLTYSEMLNSRPVLEAVVSQFQLAQSADQLAKRVTAQPVRDTQLIRLTVEDPSPNQAAQLANAIAQEFIIYIQAIQTERYAGTIENTQAAMDALALQMETIQSEIPTITTAKVFNDADLLKLEALKANDHSRHQQLEQDVHELQWTLDALQGSIRIAEPARVITGTASLTATMTLLLDQTMVAGDDGFSLETYKKMLVSRSVLSAAIEKLGRNIDPDVLENQVSAVTVPGTLLVQLDIVDPDSSQAVTLAEAITEVFINQVLTLQVKPYQDRMSSLQAQLGALQQEIEDDQANIDALTFDNLRLDTQIADLERQLAEFRVDHRTLQQDLNQMQLAADNADDAVVIAELASIPEDSTQNRVLYVSLAGAVSAVIALGCGFLIEYLTDVIRTSEDIHQVHNLRTLGSIGQFNGAGSDLVVVSQPHSPVTEAFLMLATNIHILTRDIPIKTILVTSPNAQEGKSMVTANLAAALTQRDLDVVVVDADLRLPRQHTLFDLDQEVGLTGSLLTGQVGEKLQQAGIRGLKVLTSGKIPPNPAELVASSTMGKIVKELSQVADLVLVDCPPVLPVADAHTLASMVDGVVVVVRAGRTRRQDFLEAEESLSKVGDNLLGAVLNGVKHRRSRYKQYYRG